MNLMTKISYGLYVITTRLDDLENGCIANTLIQQTENPMRLSVTLSNTTYTCQLAKKSLVLGAAILNTETPFETIKLFGMNKGNEIKKFDNIPTILSPSGLRFPKDNVIGYLEMKVIKTEDLGTHTLFIGDLVHSQILQDGTPLTYSYYHKYIKPQPGASSKNSYICTICNYEHPEEPSADFICPICNHGKEYFIKKETLPSVEIKKEGEKNMSKFVCMVCGYVHNGEDAPENCPICKAPAEKFLAQEGEMTWAAEHVIGVAKGAPEEILEDLRANFQGECCEVGMYLAMSRAAFREGYPEIGLYYEKAALEEAEHAAKFAELLGEVVCDSTKRNLELRIEAENGATLGKTELAKKAKALNLDAIHDTVHEMARDEARHGKAFLGLYNRYFKK